MSLKMEKSGLGPISLLYVTGSDFVRKCGSQLLVSGHSEF